MKLLQIDDPNDCFECPLYSKRGYVCMATHKMVQDEEKMIIFDDENCPLISVQEFDRKRRTAVKEMMEAL